MIRFLLTGLCLVAQLLALGCAERKPDRLPIGSRTFATVQFGADGPRWSFVNEGSELYLDRNPDDGIDLIESIGAKRATLPLGLSSKDGSTQYREMTVGLLLSPATVSPDRPQQLFVEVHVTGGGGRCFLPTGNDSLGRSFR